jgi:hypothetical protein
VTADRLDSSALVLTGNTESLYAFVVFDLKKDGPTVFEVPPGVMGPLDDHNFLFVADIGPTGMDQGQGGKYLLLPPGYEGDVPDGYFVVRSPTYANFSFIRANAAVVGFGDKALEFYRKHAKVYPLKTGPRPPVVKNVTGIPWNSLVPEDASAFEWMHEIIDYEPAEAFGKELLGRLASLGIVRAALRARCPHAADLRQGRRAGRRHVARDRLREPPARGAGLPEPDVGEPLHRQQLDLRPAGLLQPRGAHDLPLHRRRHHPAMAMQMPEGKGSRYQTTYKDADGNYLDGSKVYKLNMPPKVPVALFWSVTVYDPWTRCELQSQPYPSISSQQDPPPKTNADGSGRHLLRRRESRRAFRRRTGSGPCRTGGSSSTSATTVRSRPSTTRPGCPTTWNSDHHPGQGGDADRHPRVLRRGADRRHDAEGLRLRGPGARRRGLHQHVPAVSMYHIRKGQRDLGHTRSNQIVIAEQMGDSKPLVLTWNNTSLYTWGFLDLKKDGPTVIEIPPDVLGILDDMYFRYISDMGAAGPDKGKGGKYLVLPPGYDGDVPDGYFVVQSRTYACGTSCAAT